MGDFKGSVWEWLGGLFLLIVGGIGTRGFNSRAKAQGAQDSAIVKRAEAEGSYFSVAISEKDLEIEHWKAASERGWAAAEKARVDSFELQRLVDKLKSEMRHLEANRKLRIKLFHAQHPEVDVSWFSDSGPAALEANIYDTDLGKLK